MVSIAVGCATLAVDYDYDTTYDFAKLKTYGWMPSPAGGQVDDLVEKRFKQTVSTQLEAKGYSPAAESPDFLVALQGTRKAVDAGSVGVGTSIGIPVGSRGSMSVGVGKSKQRVKQEGTLTLNVLDAKTNAIIWEGTASAEIQPKSSPEEQQQRINQVVAELLAHFPPQVKQ
jgi:hypothetical protein